MNRFLALLVFCLPLVAIADDDDVTTLKCADDRVKSCQVKCFVFRADGKDQKVLDVNRVSRVTLRPMEEGTVLLEIVEVDARQAFLTNADTVCEFRDLGM